MLVLNKPLRFTCKKQRSVMGSADWTGSMLALAAVGQWSDQAPGRISEQVILVVCDPQTVSGICNQTQRGEIRLDIRIDLANGYKSQAIIPNQSFARPNPEIAVVCLRYGVDTATRKACRLVPNVSGVARHNSARPCT
jgi:hypothetical protein